MTRHLSKPYSLAPGQWPDRLPPGASSGTSLQLDLIRFIVRETARAARSSQIHRRTSAWCTKGQYRGLTRPYKVREAPVSAAEDGGVEGVQAG